VAPISARLFVPNWPDAIASPKVRMVASTACEFYSLPRCLVAVARFCGPWNPITRMKITSCKASEGGKNRQAGQGLPRLSWQCSSKVLIVIVRSEDTFGIARDC
jgi:hypothetical protein